MLPMPSAMFSRVRQHRRRALHPVRVRVRVRVGVRVGVRVRV